MAINISILLNDNYKVLSTIYNSYIEIMGEKCCPLSQEEIAKLCSLTRPTITNIINKLKKEHFIEKNLKEKKRYKLTPKAIEILNIIENCKY